MWSRARSLIRESDRLHRDDAGADVDRDALDVIASDVDLSRVQTRTDLETQRLHRFGDRLRASNASRGSVEGSWRYFGLGSDARGEIEVALDETGSDRNLIL